MGLIYVIFIVVICIIFYYFLNKPVLKSGIVTEKFYEPKRHCTVYACVPSTGGVMKALGIEPERWAIIIEGTMNNKKTERKIYISKKRYDELSIGDTFSIQ